MLSMPEKLAIYRKALGRPLGSYVRIAVDLGVSDKTLRAWKTKTVLIAARLEQRSADEALQRLLYHTVQFPWSFEADQQTYTLYGMSLNRQTSDIYKSYAYSADCAYREAETINVNAPPFTQAQWGAALFAYYFYLAMLTSKDGTYSNETAKRRFGILQATFGSMIATVKETWAVVYSMKIVGNRVVTAWDTTPKGRRNSPEMHKLVADSNYFAAIDLFMQLCPWDTTWPHNGLAAASVFNQPDRYLTLLKYLGKADKRYRDLEKLASAFGRDVDPFLDEDFDNLRRWLAERGWETSR
jgi:hypothetical protein